MKKNKMFPYYTLGEVPVEDFLEHVPLDNKSKLPLNKEYFGQSVRMSRERYKVFAMNGTQCKKCGRRGTIAAIQKHTSQQAKNCHVNIYGYSRDGRKFMMQIDHIIPRARGGPNTIENKQPLCSFCNNKKADSLE
jgi:5-methylcytosine-specific restriction endonuclease McrA